MPCFSAAFISSSAVMPALLASIKNLLHSSAKPLLWHTLWNALSLGASSFTHLRIIISLPCADMKERLSPPSLSTLLAKEVKEYTPASQSPAPISCARARSVSKVNCSGTIYNTGSPLCISSAAMALRQRLLPLPALPVNMVTSAIAAPF